MSTVGRLMLIPDEEILEEAVLAFSHRGDDSLIKMVALTWERLRADRVRFEILFPDRPVGLNVAILQLESVLAKTGYGG